MTKEQLILLIGGVFALAILAIIIPIAINSFRNKRGKYKNRRAREDEMLENAITVKKVNAQVINVGCNIITEENRQIKQFLVSFRTEEDEFLHFYVTEAYHDAFEFGQRGLLTLVDGNLDSFELENK